jgi:YYY domain-containing protein
MATLFALPFMLAYSAAGFLIEVYEKNSTNVLPKFVDVIAGIIAGACVCLSGNLHAAVYGFFFPSRNFRDFYWFTDATRFIGYHPDVPHDKTIHEYPVYSFIVSDLHPHVINMIFVITIIALVISLAVTILRVYRKADAVPWLFKHSLLRWVSPASLLVVFLIGLAPASNFWDYPIYVVFLGAMCFYVNLKAYSFSIKSIGISIAQMGAAAAIAYLVMTPFHLHFDTMGAELRLVEHRSMIYQLLILWGYQLFFAAALTFMMVTRYKLDLKPNKARQKQLNTVLNPHSDLYIPVMPDKPKHPFLNFIESVNPADGIAFVIFICGIGLFLIPEFVYVLDIYPSHPRSNTMFKLGFQAFIMFGIASGYCMTRLLFETVTNFPHKKIVTAGGIFILICAFMYPVYAIPQWYGKFTPSRIIGLDGTTYMYQQTREYKGAGMSDEEKVQISLADDHALIQYINENIEGAPVIAEANGDAYTVNGRISVNTGLQNVFNWYFHQFLWRNSNAELLDPRRDDINNFYKSDDEEFVRKIIDKYNIKYIVIGEMERLMYPEMNESLLTSMGEVVFRSNDLYMVKVDPVWTRRF